MIVVLGRPALVRSPLPDGTPADDGLGGLPAAVALAAVRAGSRVELVGSIGDDPDGDRVAVLLGRAGVGHAALLRDPAGHTPVTGQDAGPPPRLDAGDVGLGLGYLADIRVLVLAEPLPAEAESAVLDAASFHGAKLVATVPAGAEVGRGLSEAATVLEAPDGDVAPFAEMVGRYAAALDAGREPAEAFSDATAAAGWERSGA